MKNAEYWIHNLELDPHPEGGHFKETYRSSDFCLPDNIGEKRNYSTAIYYLLQGNEYSAWHRIKSDEMWHLYAGEGLIIYQLSETGLSTHILGTNLEQGQKPQLWVPANTWFASSCINEKSYGLAGCTVSPGFDFRDFEMAKKEELLKNFGPCDGIIEKFSAENA